VLVQQEKRKDEKRGRNGRAEKETKKEGRKVAEVHEMQTEAEGCDNGGGEAKLWEEEWEGGSEREREGE
jgi:hypothetical protein